MQLSKKHENLIKTCSKMALDSYDKLSCSYDHSIENKDFDVIVFFKLIENNLFIFGPGSESLTDWSLDFQIWRQKCSYLDNSLIHSGFFKIYNSIRDSCLTYIKQLIQQNKDLRIICTGHSLFGAIATIISADISCFDNHISCITFGSPRVGNNKFAKYFNSNVDTSFRCVFLQDPITFSPLPIRFKHVRGCIQCNPTNISLNSNFNKWNFIGCKIAHHSMDSYINSIFKI